MLFQLANLYKIFDNCKLIAKKIWKYANCFITLQPKKINERIEIYGKT